MYMSINKKKKMLFDQVLATEKRFIILPTENEDSHLRYFFFWKKINQTPKLEFILLDHLQPLIK